MERYYSSLERRYYSKREELDDKIERISTIINEQLNQGGGGEALGARLKSRYEGVQRDIERVRSNIGRVNEEEEAFREEIGRREMEERGRFERDKGIESTNFERITRGIEEIRIRLESEINRAGEGEAEEERRIDTEFEDLRNEASERINKRDTSGDSELSRRIASILEFRGLLSDYDERANAFQRYKAHLESIRGGAWKTW